jgi:hypothetical protein
MASFLSMKRIRAAAKQLGGDDAFRRSQKHCVGALDATLLDATRNHTAKAYGLEIELPCSPGDGTLFRELSKLPIDRKRDGSLNGEDIEFVFPPMSTTQWRTSTLFDQFARIYNEQLATGRAAPRYGTHIHTNVNGWHPASALLIRPLVRNNADFFKWIAGREPYDPLGQKPLADQYTTFTDRSVAGVQWGFGTVEYRIFDATVDKQRLLSWMSILDGIETYVRKPEIIEAWYNRRPFLRSYAGRDTVREVYDSRGDFVPMQDNMWIQIHAHSPVSSDNRYDYSVVNNVRDAYTADVLDEYRFRDWMLGDECKNKHPLLAAAYERFIQLGMGWSFEGSRSFAEFIRTYNTSRGNRRNATPTLSPVTA